MQIPNGVLGRGKQVVHGIQALLVFIAWAVTIAIFTEPGSTGGATKFYFLLCWLCLPAFIFLAAVPAFARSKRFANPYALAAVDVIFTILWFSALIAVAAWTNSGIKAGEAKKNDNGAKGCPAFDGPEATCSLSKVTVDLGVLIFLLFIVTSGISIYSLIYYRKHGALPNSRPVISDPISMEAQKYAFSSNPNDEPEDQEEIDLGASRPPRGRDNGGDEYELLHTDTHEGRHPGRPLSWGREPSLGEANQHDDETVYDATHHMEQDTAYHGSSAYDPPQSSQHSQAENPFKDPSHPPNLQYQPSDPFRYDVSLSHEHGGYGGSTGHVEFPHADYTRDF